MKPEERALSDRPHARPRRNPHAILAQIFGQTWFPAAALILIAGSGFLYWGYRVGLFQPPPATATVRT
jgi:nitrate reductase NapE component